MMLISSSVKKKLKARLVEKEDEEVLFVVYISVFSSVPEVLVFLLILQPLSASWSVDPILEAILC